MAVRRGRSDPSWQVSGSPLTERAPKAHILISVTVTGPEDWRPGPENGDLECQWSLWSSLTPYLGVGFSEGPRTLPGSPTTQEVVEVFRTV